jgi:hypothetical protein
VQRDSQGQQQCRQPVAWQARNVIEQRFHP